MSHGSVGLLLGGITAIGGAGGAIFGGRLADMLLKRTPRGRIWVGIGAVVIPLPFTIAMCLTHNATVFFLCFLPTAFIGKTWIACGAATIQDLVLPRMRGTATNVYFLFATLVGSGLAPYVVGKISELTHSLATGLWWTSTFAVMAAACSLWLCAQGIERSEGSRAERAAINGGPE